MRNIFSFSLVLGALLTMSATANALAKVPEPSSLSLLGLSLVIVGLVSRKKK